MLNTICSYKVKLFEKPEQSFVTCPIKFSDLQDQNLVGIRIIQNLKSFIRNYVDKIHFKTESLKSVVNAFRKDCFSCYLQIHKLSLNESCMQLFLTITKAKGVA